MPHDHVLTLGTITKRQWREATFWRLLITRTLWLGEGKTYETPLGRMLSMGRTTHSRKTTLVTETQARGSTVLGIGKRTQTNPRGMNLVEGVGLKYN